jgi:hypothetical protein
VSIKQKYLVKTISATETHDWLLNKHYAKRLPGSILFAFGLYDKNVLVGVVTFGMSPNSNMNEIGGMRILELNRLCINDSCGKNVASYFIAQTYKFLLQYVLISYADEVQGHHGYIYQALNWTYTGESAGGKMLETASGMVHQRAYDQRRKKESIISSSNGKKHRYFYVPSGDRGVLSLILSRFPEQPYPKGDNKRYDASYAPETQGILF